MLTEDYLVNLETFSGRFRARREPKGHQEQFRVYHLMRAQLDLVRLHLPGFTEAPALEKQIDFVWELKG